MKSIYDYDNNIQVVKTPNDDIVITMNKAIFVSLLNRLYDAARSQEEQHLNATAEDTYKLRATLNAKGEV